ncbi:MAG: SDR family NAD(P)-dependent oxidoreductase [Desulfomonilaceae bacterium]
MKSDGPIRVFSGATAIVTGGASGIGRALAEELAKRGCEVVLADRQIVAAEEVASGIRTLAGGKATAANLDVTDFPALQQLVNDTVERTGRLDYMFNNAGIAIGGSVRDYGIPEWNQIIDVNLRGVVNGVQAAYCIMMKQGFGHIVNTASMAGLIPSPGNVAYSMTKHAVVGLSKSLRAEAAILGIRVSALCPGVIRTPILYGGGLYGKMLIDIPQEKLHQLWERLKPMSPGGFAEKVIDSVAKNKPIIVVPSWWKLLWWTNRLSPSLGIALAQKSFHKRTMELGLAREI